MNLYSGSSLRLSRIPLITPTYAPTRKQNTASPRGENSEEREVAWLILDSERRRVLFVMKHANLDLILYT